MAKDAVATMGAVLPDDTGGRDAVHVAVFAAVSDDKLMPGQAVSILAHDDKTVIVKGLVDGKKGVGIVDPFIDAPIKSGQRFWVYLYPRTITALAHRWSHPAFEKADTSYVPPSQKLVSEKWLKDFCKSHDAPDYKTFMQVVRDHLDSKSNEKSLFVGSQDAHGDIPDELWDHVGNVLGRAIGDDEKPKYFSCSC
jgi:hypothetical protein